MRRVSAALLCLLLAASSGAGAVRAPKRPRPEVFGVRLEMSKREAHARLRKLGSLEKEQRKNQEVWAVTDRRVSHLIVGFDPDDRVRYVTALARPDAPRIRYDEIASLKTAQLSSAPGSYKYTWEVEGKRTHASGESREREEEERRERESKERREREREERREGKERREPERNVEDEGYVVIARGRDPQFLDSYSVKKVLEEEID